MGLSARTIAACCLTTLLTSAGVLPTKDKLTEDEKIELLRGLGSEYAKVKVMVPCSKKALDYNADGS